MQSSPMSIWALSNSDNFLAMPMLRGATLETMTSFVASRYRHMQAKSSDISCSSDPTTTWKMLGRSCRSPTARAMWCSRFMRSNCARIASS